MPTGEIKLLMSIKKQQDKTQIRHMIFDGYLVHIVPGLLESRELHVTLLGTGDNLR
jgi:hypothetical protein